jgi:hypothetical protein
MRIFIGSHVSIPLRSIFFCFLTENLKLVWKQYDPWLCHQPASKYSNRRSEKKRQDRRLTLRAVKDNTVDTYVI